MVGRIPDGPHRLAEACVGIPTLRLQLAQSVAVGCQSLHSAGQPRTDDDTDQRALLHSRIDGRADAVANPLSDRRGEFGERGGDS